MKSDKRQPALADLLLRQPYGIQRDIMTRAGANEWFLSRKRHEDVCAKVRRAHRFVFDADAAKRLGEITRDIPELLIREHQFARAPYDLTWVEYHIPDFVRGVSGQEPASDADLRVGYLLDNQRVTVVSAGTLDRPNAPPMIGPIEYDVNTEWHEDEEAETCRRCHLSPDHLHAILWGSTQNRLPPETMERVRRMNAVRIPPEIKVADKLQRVLLYSAGEIRNIVAFLLCLNRPSLTMYRNVPMGRGWIGNKTASYMAHTAITIDLNAVATLRLIGTPQGDGVPRRRHEVRGHFCHDHNARDYLRIAGCIHDWQVTALDEVIPDFPIRWECAACGGRRWWKHAHERGDASRGWVSHDYNVTS